MKLNIKDVMEYTGMSRVEVLGNLSRALGTTDTKWRCGATGRISDGLYDCTCDSVLCDLGEEVSVAPLEGK